MQIHYCGCDIQLQSVITVSEEGETPCDYDEHTLAWEALYVPSTPDGMDPNKAPTEIAPSIPDVEQGETPSIPETPHYDPAQGDVSPEDTVRGEATHIVAKESMTQTPPLLSRLIRRNILIIQALKHVLIIRWTMECVTQTVTTVSAHWDLSSTTRLLATDTCLSLHLTFLGHIPIE